MTDHSSVMMYVPREKSRRTSAKLHHFACGPDQYILDVEGGRVCSLPFGHGAAILSSLQIGDVDRAELIGLGLGLLTPSAEVKLAPKTVPLKALSLAVAQKCNLGCTYCYAQGGTFGSDTGNMSLDVAKASVDRLLGDMQHGEKATLAFMGGEPLANRRTLHAATHYAAEQASLRNLSIGFTMTTNGTLVRPEDIELFQRYHFTLTISIDGLKETNDQLRPFVSGKGSFERLSERVAALLMSKDRNYKVFARSTVTPQNLDLPDIMNGLLDMGFDSIMFSPMLSAPSGKGEMQASNLDVLLRELIKCGEIFREKLKQGSCLGFSNMITTLKRIHSYQKEQYPCGAGGGYMGVSAEGEMYACHRFVNDDRGHMGSISHGVDRDKQSKWLSERRLDSQVQCTECWARYLCSGSCHYEVINRGRPACDYIRGWLDYCLSVYAEMLRDEPELLREILET